MVKVNSREESSTDTLGMYQTNIFLRRNAIWFRNISATFNFGQIGFIL